jgi:hypothetical protein
VCDPRSQSSTSTLVQYTVASQLLRCQIRLFSHPQLINGKWEPRPLVTDLEIPFVHVTNGAFVLSDTIRSVSQTH